METKKLIMFFLDSYGRKSSIFIDDPKFDLNPGQVQTAMDLIVENKVLVNSFQQPFEVTVGAQITTTHIETITE